MPPVAAVGQLVEDEHRASEEQLERRIRRDGPRPSVRDGAGVGDEPARSDRFGRAGMRACARERLERRRPEGHDDVTRTPVRRLEPSANRPDVRDVVPATVRGLDARLGHGLVEGDRQRDVAPVEDDRAGGRIDEGARERRVAAEARHTGDHEHARRGVEAPDEDGLVGVDRVLDEDRPALRRGHGRPQHRRLADPFLRPRARVLVQPGVRLRGTDAQAELDDVVRPVDVRPEEALHLGPGRERDEQRPVADHGRREVLEPAPRRVGPPARVVDGSGHRRGL